jgi:uncharacterized membrane protein YgdD (TMEM256/DUF423 family)
MIWTAWIGTGSFLAALGVGMGAFGAHALKARLSPDMLAVFDTAVRWHMYHALALLAVGMVATRIESLPLKIAGFSFVLGMILFSGSLYALTLTGNRSLGMITPIGGVFLIAGWLALAFSVFKPS